MKKILNIWFILVAYTSLGAQGIPINTYFDLRSGLPLDKKTVITTLADTATIVDPYEGLLTHVNDADVYYKYNGATWEIFDPGGGGGAVSSVNSQTGAVVLDADDIDDTSTANKFTNAADVSKLAGIEAGATADQSNAEIETAYNAQVGIVSQINAESGTSTTAERWTPQRVAQAISALASDVVQIDNNLNGGQTAAKEVGILTGNYYDDLLAGVLVPIADNTKLGDTVAMPTAFPYVPTWAIYRDGNGKFSTQLDNLKTWRDSLFIPGKAYYVDIIGGNDANDGLSKNTAFQTIAQAATKTDWKNLYIAGGIYTTENLNSLNPTSDTVCISGYGGRVSVGNILDAVTWTATSMANVYKATFASTVSRILSTEIRDEFGVFVRMNVATDTSALLNNPGAYRVEPGNLVYLHTLSGDTPSVYNNFIAIGTANYSLPGGTHRYFEGLDFYGATSTTTAGGTKNYFRDCGFFHSGGADQLFIGGKSTDEYILHSCRLAYSLCDGYNYEDSPHIAEINCIGAYAGLDDSSGRCQVSTAHDTTAIIRINADYKLASDEVVYDVNTYGSVTLGGTFYGKFNNTDAGATFALGHAAKMWIEGAKFGGNMTYDLGGSATLYLRDVKINSATRLDPISTLVKW